MKAKKALRRLTKVETLLSNVIDQFPLNQDGLSDLLDSAKTAVTRAVKTVKSQLSSTVARKAPARAKAQGRPSEGRKKTSIAARKRMGAAKSANGAVGRRLRKTA